MRDVSKLRLLCSSFCTQYQSDAKFYIDQAHDSEIRHLVVVYEKGGYGGGKEFAAAIPKAWTDQDVLNLILWPMKDPKAPYPAWEVPARVNGRPTLYEWWKDAPTTCVAPTQKPCMRGISEVGPTLEPANRTRTSGLRRLSK